MGTDIHLFVERKTAAGAWEQLTVPAFYTAYLARSMPAEVPLEERLASAEAAVRLGARVPPGRDYDRASGFYNDRSYPLFAWLADVRNYHDVAPIAECRGFPADASSYVHDDYTAWGRDAYSPSWLLVDEVLLAPRPKGHAEYAADRFMELVHDLRFAFPGEVLRFVFWFDC